MNFHTSNAGDCRCPVTGHGDDGSVDKVSIVIQPTSYKMVEEDIAPEFVVNHERIGRVLRPQIEKGRVFGDEKCVSNHLPVVVTRKIVPQLWLCLVDVIQSQIEGWIATSASGYDGRLLASAEFPVSVRQELGRIPGRCDKRRRFDVAMTGVQLSDDRRIDKEQITDKLNISHGDWSVSVKDLQIVNCQFTCEDLNWKFRFLNI